MTGVLCLETAGVHQIQSRYPEVGCAHKGEEGQPEEPGLQLGVPGYGRPQQSGKGFAEQHRLSPNRPAEQRKGDWQKLHPCVIYCLAPHPPEVIDQGWIAHAKGNQALR